MHIRVPHLVCDIVQLEKVQELATICVNPIRPISYPERVNYLKGVSLRRILHDDLIATYNISSGFILVDPNQFFYLRESRNVRSQSPHAC